MNHTSVPNLDSIHIVCWSNNFLANAVPPPRVPVLSWPSVALGMCVAAVLRLQPALCTLSLPYRAEGVLVHLNPHTYSTLPFSLACRRRDGGVLLVPVRRLLLKHRRGGRRGGARLVLPRARASTSLPPPFFLPPPDDESRRIQHQSRASRRR